jgi:hypothetical protein
VVFSNVPTNHKRKRKRQSSSFVGPLIVGLIADSTGNIRYAFFFLVVMIWLAVPVLLSVDVERGRVDAQTYSVARAAAVAVEEDADTERATAGDEAERVPYNHA